MTEPHDHDSPIVRLLREEFAQECQTTRRPLERLTEDGFSWRPHPKSYTAGMLAMHIVDCLGWVDDILTSDELVMDPAAYRPFVAASVPDLLEAFDARAAGGAARLAQTSEAALLQPWRLVLGGKVRFEKPRLAVFRDFTLNHIIHHRGQLPCTCVCSRSRCPAATGPPQTSLSNSQVKEIDSCRMH